MVGAEIFAFVDKSNLSPWRKVIILSSMGIPIRTKGMLVTRRRIKKSTKDK